jgi:hypothetical protein
MKETRAEPHVHFCEFGPGAHLGPCKCRCGAYREPFHPLSYWEEATMVNTRSTLSEQAPGGERP